MSNKHDNARALEECARLSTRTHWTAGALLAVYNITDNVDTIEPIAALAGAYGVEPVQVAAVMEGLRERAMDRRLAS